MNNLREAAEEFLAQKRIAVVGVSRSPGQSANFVYQKLKNSGYEVFAVNPKAQRVEGDRCYSDLASIEPGVDAVVVATHPRVSEQVVRDCAALGISHVWLHRSFGEGSVSPGALRVASEEGISIIPGACPAMFCKPVDVGHRCIRWFLGATGRLTDAASM